MFLIYFLKMSFIVFFSAEIGMEVIAAVAGYGYNFGNIIVCSILLTALLVDDLLMKSELRE